MTEYEWLTCAEPAPMLEFLGDNVTDRQLRLFAAGCCRRLWGVLVERSKMAVEAAEQYADGRLGANHLAAHFRAAWEAAARFAPGSLWYAAATAVVQIVGPGSTSEAATIAADAIPSEPSAQAELLRDILGNPFRPVRLDPTWIAEYDGIVVKLAHGIYDKRAFDRMPILADALLDAGCDDDLFLDHCRAPRIHTRGCWVLDALIGRS